MISLNKPKHDSIRKSSNLFLIEMIIALLFFCISGAVILQVFASAGSTIRGNQRCDNAVLCAQSCAEAYSVSGNIDEMLTTVFENQYSNEDGKYTIPLDINCKPTGLTEVILTLTERRENTSAGTLLTVTAVFTAQEEEFYRLDFSAYKPINGGGGDE